MARRLENDPDFLDALAEAEAAAPKRVEKSVNRATVRAEQRRKDRERKKREHNEAAKGIKYVQLSDGRWVPGCGGTNLVNEPCKQIVVRKGKVLKSTALGVEDCIASGGFCLRHDPKVSDEWIKGITSRAGRKRKIGPDEYIREMVNSAVGIFVRPHLKALGAVIDDDTGEIKLVPGTGAKIYGESKDGYINMTDYDDVEAQQKASERLLDRGFGKPRTQTEISITPAGGSSTVPPTAERARDVAMVLAECGAIQADDTEEENE